MGLQFLHSRRQLKIKPERIHEFQDFFHENKVARVLMWLITFLYPVWLVLSANGISYVSGQKAVDLLRNNPGSFFYGLFMLYLLFFGLAFLCRRIWISALFWGIILFVFPAIDYYKMLVQQVHFFPWDLMLAKNTESFAQFVPEIILPEFYWEIIGVSLFFVIFFFAAKPGLLSVKYWKSVLLAIICFVCTQIILSQDQIRQNYANLCGISLDEIKDQSTNFESHGFVTAFLLNFGYLDTDVPQGYSMRLIEETFGKYLPEEQDNGDWVNPDVLIVLSESYWDPTVLNGVTFSEDPLKYYREIAQSHPSGTMISPSFGGGTARPEFEVLTGMSTNSLPTGTTPHQQYIYEDTFSFGWYFRDMGYDTVAVHTYEETFYDRNRVYPLLGIDDFRGNYGLHVDYHWNSYWYITDETLADEVIYELNQPHDTGVFIMAITMENHGLYYEKFKDYDWDIKVSSDALNDADIITLQNFAKGVSDSDAALKQLYDFVMEREKPTAVLWFGDHLPTLGDNFEIYTKTGTIEHSDSTEWTEEEKYTMLSTPYLIFTNYDTGNDFYAQGECVSPYLLPALFLEYINAPESLQTNFLLDVYNTCPVIDSAYGLYSDGVAEDEINRIIPMHWLMTYDQMIGKRYIQQLTGGSPQ